MATTKTFTKRAIAKSLENQRDKGFNAGVKMALSIAVNHFNIPDHVRTGVLKKMNVK